MDEIKPRIVEQKSGREYKDSFFKTLFQNEERILELCNALEGTDYQKGTPLKFYSQEGSSLIRRRNDLAVIIADQLLALKDHQSSINPNMPLRYLPFVAEILYTWLEDKKELFANKLVTIPTPKFYVFYNGKERLKHDILRLSDAFRTDNHGFSVELVVKVIDVNYNSKNDILLKSPSMGGYSYLMEQIRQRLDGGVLRDKAIKESVNHCIDKGVLANFLEEHYMEVCDMMSWDITLEEEIEVKVRVSRELGREEGEERGLLKSALKLLNKGKSIQEVSNDLELTDSQREYLENNRIATI